MAKNKKKDRSHSQPESTSAPEERQDRLELHGVVDEALPGTLFKVKTDKGITVLCTLSGKLRQHHIRILPGDNVVIVVSPYDLSKGRISWRK